MRWSRPARSSPGSYEIAGPDTLTFEEITEIVAEQLGKKHRSVNLPASNAALEARLATAVVDADYEVLRPLMEGLESDLLVNEMRYGRSSGWSRPRFARRQRRRLSRSASWRSSALGLRRLGFAVKVLSDGGLPSHDTRRWQSEPHLSVSLERLRAVLERCDAMSIRMYRMASSLAPYASHPEHSRFQGQVKRVRRGARRRRDLQPGARDPTLISPRPVHRAELRAVGGSRGCRRRARGARRDPRCDGTRRRGGGRAPRRRCRGRAGGCARAIPAGARGPFGSTRTRFS